MQTPKVNHPWRRYKNRLGEDGQIETKATKEDRVTGTVSSNIKPVKTFLSELIDNWENIDVVTFAFGREDRYSLIQLPQSKIAAWIAGMLKRNYGQG